MLKRFAWRLSSRDESQQIPEEGRDLQNQIIECGLERMIASHDVKDIADYFEPSRAASVPAGPRTRSAQCWSDFGAGGDASV